MHFNKLQDILFFPAMIRKCTMWAKYTMKNNLQVSLQLESHENGKFKSLRTTGRETAQEDCFGVVRLCAKSQNTYRAAILHKEL